MDFETIQIKIYDSHHANLFLEAPKYFDIFYKYVKTEPIII